MKTFLIIEIIREKCCRSKEICWVIAIKDEIH